MSFLSTEAEVTALLDQLPALAGPREVVELSGGLTNRNFKVTTAGGRFVARCTDTSTNFLEIDRDQEHYNTCAAERSGVGAPVIDYRPEIGVLLLGFVDGKTLSNADFQRPGVIAKAAASCRILHAGPRFQGRFDMFERQPGYLKTVQGNGFPMPADYLQYADKFADIEAALRVGDQTTVPCNNDLLAANFVEDGDKIWLIDYEYSGNNDPCFELGNIWSECGLTLEQLDDLVTAYYGTRLRNKIARARLQGIVAKYGWTLWGCIQNASCPIEYDFWEWAMERYDAAIAEFNGPDFARLLTDVTRTD